MTPEQWQELQELFEEVIQKPLHERPSALKHLESKIQDSAICLELRRLVEHAEASSEFLRPVAGLGIDPDLTVLRPGDVIADRFEIRQFIGRGGMAEVFEALDQKLAERVAIKVIAPQFARDLVLFQRFYQEVQIARRITHPNICRIHDLGEHQGLPYLSMEFLEGETLSRRLERGALPLETWNDCAQQLFRGLRAAHEAGVVHRDLKPSNLMLTGSRLVILDFGLARPILTQEDDGLTRTGTLVGTLDWMAPEQLLGEYDERSDLYSAALILLRALKQGADATGGSGLVGALRRATTDTEFRQQMPKSLPAPWRYALLRCLEREPARRPRSVQEVQKLVQSQHILPVQLQRFISSYWKAAAIVLVVLALFGASIRSLWYSRQLRPLGLKPGAVIMIVPTDNATHESQFDGVTSVLRAEFGQSSHFNLWDERRFGEVLRGMRLDPQTKPATKQWREMAFRENVSLLVFSTVSKLGDGYKFSIRCELIGKTTPESPVDFREDTETALGPAGLFEAIHHAVTSMRIAAGESDTERAATNRLPQDITSPSWEALELFSEAQALSDDQRSDEAVPLLRRAVQLDSNFAMGLMRLGDILNAQEKHEEGFAFWRRAIALARAQHLSEHERLSIESRYALEIRDFNQAEPVLRDWARRFPNDPLPMQLLAWCLVQIGNYEEGLRVAREGQDRFPPTVFGTSVLIRALAAKNEFADIDKQITILESLSSRPLALGFRGTVAVLRGKYDAGADLFREVMRSDDVKEASRATAQLAHLEADRGNLDIARQLLGEGISKDLSGREDGFASQKTIALAFLEGMSGNPGRAVARAKEAVMIRPAPLVIVQAVSIVARYGSPEEAALLMKMFPPGEGPEYEAGRLRMRGEIFAAKGNLKLALALLEQAASTDRPHEPKEYLARVRDLAQDRQGAILLYQGIADTSWLTWVSEDEWPGIRFLARQYLENSKGE
jgi:serine/threonine protein kinase/tetratricopeptide (TPR) repeat protein